MRQFSGMRQIGYPLDQWIAEIERVGGVVDRSGIGVSYRAKDKTAALRRLKMRGVPPDNGTFDELLLGTQSPWGRIDSVYALPDEAEGIYSVSTPSHGGLWLSADWKKKLPKWYEPFTGNKTWAEEDCDGAIVLQAFGLLTLFHEFTTLMITQADIDRGYESRKPARWDSKRGRYGGAISEAYKRTFGYDKDLIVSGDHMCKQPGGWACCRLNAEAEAFQADLDAGKHREPQALSFVPWIYTKIRL